MKPKESLNMKTKTVLETFRNKFEQIKSTRFWKKMFIYQIDEEKLSEIRNQHLMGYITFKSLH